MPKIPSRPIPTPQKTISQIVGAQLPDFIQEADPNFIAFLQAYYEWLEKNGEEVFNCKIISSSQYSVTLTNTAATTVDYYNNMNVVCLNGPAKGFTRKIVGYDPATNIVQVESWDPTNVPPPNTRISIRDALYPTTLLEYRDIDLTLDRFINYFRDDFMYQIPGNILADKRNILKHIKQFYQARGTENSFRFLFRILFNQEMEFYYPKVDLFRPSDARWYVQNVMKITTTGNTFDYVNRQLIGVATGTTAKVESATQQTVSGGTVTTLTLSSIDGAYQIDPMTSLPEQVKIVYPVLAPPQTDLGAQSDLLEDSTAIKWESTYQLLQSLLVGIPGQNYAVGETITINGGGELSPATAVITSVFQTIYTGGCQPPPTTYYLEPYFGPDDTVNADPDPTTDAVCIPGLYFFSDVHSTYTLSDLLNSTEILLSANETTTDDFFVGDEIDLTGGTGQGQRRTIVSYNGTTKVATVNESWLTIPDGTTQYSITYVKGGIKSVEIVDFGLGFTATPTVTINTANGTGAVLPPTLGIVGQTAGMWLPGRAGGIGEAPTTTDSFASSNKIIQDSFYWQDFSYDLRVGETIDKYRDVVKMLLHPAGMKMFGTVLLKSKPDTNFLEIVKQYTLDIGAKFFDLDLDVSNTTTLEINTITPQVVGTRWKDFDSWKFTAFPPNVNFNLIYPFPNQNYWTTNGPGNTQIANLKDIVIGDIINFPDRRTKINADAYVVITNGNSLTKVGPVGQSRFAITQSRFTGFPPYEGFNQVYPYPNNLYWVGPLGGVGNTQIKDLANIVLSQLIQNPHDFHSNICIDSTITVSTDQDQISLIGDQVEYSFLEGVNPQIVYNVSPNYYSGEYDGVLGSNITTESIDGTYVLQGVALDSSASQIVNASAVPMNLKRCTVIVVAYANGISTDSTIIGMIANPTDNGFAIDMRDGGGISFRARYSGVEKTVDFPPTTIANQTYFLAALRFNEGLLSGNVATPQHPNANNTISSTFSSYPSAPSTTSGGWYFGSPSTDFVPVAQSPALFKASTYGSTKFGQAAITGSPITMGYFNGYLCYAIFYDRALYNYEIDTVYERLSELLLSQRGINMNAGTLYRTQIGAGSIRKTTHQTQLGGAYIIDTRQKTISGLSRIRTTVQHVNTGFARLQQTAVLKTLTGAAGIRRGASWSLTGLSRIQLAGETQTLTGRTRIRNTSTQTATGHAAVRKTTTQTQSGVTRLLVSGVDQSIIGHTRIFKTEFQTQIGAARLELFDQRTMIGTANIRNTTLQTQAGTVRITHTTVRSELGLARIQVTTPQTLTGHAAIQLTEDQPQFGTARIQIRTTQTQNGVSTIS